MQDNTAQLSTGLSYSYIYCIDDYLAFFTNPLFSTLPYIDEETDQLSKELKAIFLSLPTILAESADIKETYALKLVGLRPLLESKYRVLKAYERELFHLTTYHQTTTLLSPEELSALHLQEEDILSMDFNQLASDCTQFVFEVSKMNTKQERASALLPYIPIKITKENYLYYIDKSIKQIAIEDTPESAELLVSILKQLFDGTTCPSYGQHFKDIVSSLLELKQAPTTEDFEENAELLKEMIDNLSKMMREMYHIICCLCNLLIFDTLDFKTLTDMHASFYDLYYSVKSLITSEEDKELFLSTLPDRVEEIKNSLEKEFQKIGTHKKIDPLFTLMQTYLMMDLGHLFSFDIKKHTSYGAETSSILNHFLEELKNQLFTLPTVDRKLRMQYFMSVLPFVMPKDTFQTYISKAFSSISKPNQSLVAAMYLSNVLEEHNFFTVTEPEQVIIDQANWHHPTSFDDDTDEHSHDHHSCNHDHNHDH